MSNYITRIEAIERMVKEFSIVPQEWVRRLSETFGNNFYGVMWGWMFVVSNSVDRSRIEKHLHPVEDEDDEMHGTLQVADLNLYAWYIGPADDHELVLGIHGAGWNFYDGVWDELYNLLGYRWHED